MTTKWTVDKEIELTDLNREYRTLAGIEGELTSEERDRKKTLIKQINNLWHAKNKKTQRRIEQNEH